MTSKRIITVIRDLELPEPGKRLTIKVNYELTEGKLKPIPIKLNSAKIDPKVFRDLSLIVNDKPNGKFEVIFDTIRLDQYQAEFIKLAFTSKTMKERDFQRYVMLKSNIISPMRKDIENMLKKYTCHNFPHDGKTFMKLKYYSFLNQLENIFLYDYGLNYP